MNHIIQKFRKTHSNSTFLDSNGIIKSLNYTNFVNDKYVGDENNRLSAIVVL